MTKTKNIITGGMICLLGLVGFIVRGAKVDFQPLYSDVRFQPTDKLHAGCTNSANILFSPQGQKITKFTLVLYYNPENIEIIRILPSTKDGIISSKVEYNKIILEVQNPTFTSSTETKSFFQLYFKSNIVGNEIVTLGTGSEVISTEKSYPLVASFNLNFASVPECEPDIIPPSISLIYPKDTTQRITLDQYFVFDIKDIGKGIDKSSINIDFNGEQYVYGSDSLKRNKNYLTFYPNTWIPIDRKKNLKIIISDNQSYGGSNIIESIYSFQSATGMSLNKQISPIVFRKMTQEAEKISASDSECIVLKKIYSKTETLNQQALESLMQKFGCDAPTLNTLSTESGDNISSEKNTQPISYKKLSVLATLGWILFSITFMLKIHYLIAYRKHKRISEELRIKN